MTSIQKELPGNGHLESEIVKLVQYVRRFREEIAQMVTPEEDQSRFKTMSEQLDAIVGTTETATNSILERMETVDGLIEDMRAADDAEKRSQLCDRINENTMLAIEACTFQDLTGQRVSKIVRSMEFVEERVNTMVSLWGQEEIDRMAKEFAAQSVKEGDEALLNGPALPTEQAFSQDDIDKLFE